MTQENVYRQYLGGSMKVNFLFWFSLHLSISPIFLQLKCFTCIIYLLVVTAPTQQVKL